MSHDLEAPIAQFVDATNAEDRERLLDAFTRDGALNDNGREFAGREAIARWSDQEHIGTHNRLAVTDVERSGGKIVVGVDVSGQGFNGHGVFTITLDGDRIGRMDIT
jgi:ketosteroid isomerase-like protein